MEIPLPPSPYPIVEKPAKKRRWLLVVLYLLLPLSVFILSSLPYVNRLLPFIALVLLAVVSVERFIPRLSRHLNTLMWALFVLTLVGSSGWFFSPFFFTLYLAAIALGFVYTPVIAIVFTLGLLLIFASSVGEVSPTADFLTLLSLLSVIPITIVLRKSFLLVQQERKGILILEPDEENAALTSLESVLTNQVNKISITIRQPITYIRQGLALLKDNALPPEEYAEVILRMSRAADKVFTLVKEFESETTNNELLGRNEHEDEYEDEK